MDEQPTISIYSTSFLGIVPQLGSLNRPPKSLSPSSLQQFESIDHRKVVRCMVYARMEVKKSRIFLKPPAPLTADCRSAF
jgi:hypothetical protein